MLSVLEVIRSATEYLQKRGVESARLNAELLLAHVLGIPRLELYLQFDRPLGETERAPLRELVRQRGERVPLQHLIGSVEFFGREFLSDQRALIPRPETERFVELVLERLPPTPASILDVGTGSGVIAVTLAAERPDCQVTAIEISEPALSLARENAARHGATVGFLLGDLLPEGSSRFDAIVANLPYICSPEIESLSPEVHHDPLLALDGGPDGLDLIRRLLADAPQRLHAGGLMALETGAGHAEALLQAAGNLRDIEVLPDYQGVFRFFFGRYG